MEKDDIKRLKIEFNLRSAEITSFLMLTFVLVIINATNTYLKDSELMRDPLQSYLILGLAAFAGLLITLRYWQKAEKILTEIEESSKKKSKRRRRK